MKVFSKTPVRLGLIGGGTDLPAFTKNNTGHIINCAINLYNYVFVEYNQSSDFFIEIENVNEKIKVNSTSIEDPILMHKYILFVPTVIKYLYEQNYISLNGHFKIKLESEIESGSGLGGSSSMLVGILNAFNHVFKLNLSKHELAENSFVIERKILGIEGGSQDFYTAAFGGVNFMHFKKNDTTLINKVELTIKNTSLFESNLLVFYTGIRRDAKIIEKEKEGLLKEVDKLSAMMDLAKLTKKSTAYILTTFDIKKFSNCLSESWELKKLSSGSVSNQFIDEIISLGEKNGAYCGKISGAGSGGYGFFIIDPSFRKNLVDKLSLKGIKSFYVKIENNGTLAFNL